MDQKQFDQIVGTQVQRCLSVLNSKAKEYGAVDRLHNFKIAAGLQQVKPKQALAGMMTKHIVSIYDMCMSLTEYPEALWNEKIGDSINYLLLLRALLEETDGEIDSADILDQARAIDTFFSEEGITYRLHAEENDSHD